MSVPEVVGGVLENLSCACSYKHSLKRIVKVLDFIQFGGPDLTVGSTVFEMWMGI